MKIGIKSVAAGDRFEFIRLSTIEIDRYLFSFAINTLYRDRNDPSGIEFSGTDVERK